MISEKAYLAYGMRFFKKLNRLINRYAKIAMAKPVNRHKITDTRPITMTAPTFINCFFLADGSLSELPFSENIGTSLISK